MLSLGTSTADAAIVVGGNQIANLVTALEALGEAYRIEADQPDPTGLGAGDIIILGQDGGTAFPRDYTEFLNAGGDIILTGGSNSDQFRSWAETYFEITDTDRGWHLADGWRKTANHPANAYLPETYEFENSLHTYHMLAFTPKPGVVLLGENSEPNFIAAFKRYGSEGSFNYMALDLGWRDGDQEAFITPWLRGSLEAARGIPEPTSLAFVMAVGVVGWRARRAGVR